MSYSPKINPNLVRRLYIYKHSHPNKTPMTKLVNEAVEEYLDKRSSDETKHRFSEAGDQNNERNFKSAEEGNPGR